MAGLSYSAHLSQKNSAINSKAKLSGVAKHNLRKYRSLEYDKENIVILWGTDKLVQDVKKVYKEQFDEAVREYNKKQTRDDRKIDDYFEKTAKSNKDMAVELIFQIGDKEFWDKNPDKRRKMDVAFKEMLERRTGLPIVMWDERLTTVAADRVLIEAGVRRENRKGYVDEIAAVFILQGYLDSKGMENGEN